MEIVSLILEIYFAGVFAVISWNLLDDLRFYNKHGKVSFEHSGKFNFKSAIFLGVIWPVFTFFAIKVFIRKIKSYFKKS